MQEILKRINERHHELREELDRHEEFMTKHHAEFEERSKNINRMLDEISSDLDSLLEEDTSSETPVQEMKIRIYIDKQTSYVHIHQKDGDHTEFINVAIESKVTHESVLKAFVELWNCNQITGSWNNLSDKLKINVRDEFNRIVRERYEPDNNDRCSMYYICSLDDGKIVATEKK